MPAVRRDVQPVAGLQFHNRIVEPKPGSTLHQQHEFVFILVVPEVGQRSVALRDDPLDANVLGLGEVSVSSSGSVVGMEERRFMVMTKRYGGICFALVALCPRPGDALNNEGQQSLRGRFADWRS